MDGQYRFNHGDYVIADIYQTKNILCRVHVCGSSTYLLQNHRAGGMPSDFTSDEVFNRSWFTDSLKELHELHNPRPAQLDGGVATFYNFLAYHNAYDKYVKHCKIGYLTESDDKVDYLSMSFVWYNKPEGQDYWENIDRRWREFLRYLKPYQRPTRELTVAEISTLLGHEVKVVR